MKLLLPILILFCLSCKQPTPKLTMADLKFADYEREFIAKNKVDVTYYIDTTFRAIYKDLGISDTTKKDRYNQRGQLIRHSAFWKGLTREFDESGFKTHEIRGGCVPFMTDIKYRFAADSLVLHEYWVTDYENVKSYNYFKGYYLFDETGHVIKSTTLDLQNNWCFYNTTYSYDANYNPVFIKGEIISNTETNENPSSVEKYIYYTNNKPDSAIIKYSGSEKWHNYTSKTYYDSLGLRYKTIEQDSIIIYYKHSIRK